MSAVLYAVEFDADPLPTTINSFSAKWNVPNDPPQDNGQQIMYWIGLQQDSAVSDQGWLIQPVITYLNGAWSVANFVVMGVNSIPIKYEKGSIGSTPVKPNDTIGGYIRKNPKFKDDLHYQCGYSVNGGTIQWMDIDFSNLPPSMTAPKSPICVPIIILEFPLSTGSDTCNNYPTGNVEFTDITVEDNGKVKTGFNWNGGSASACSALGVTYGSDSTSVTMTNSTPT